ncbi:ABC transporter ATP-binding protein [Kaustia mangrovi]|uniref:Spermidine/putrescine import ATP-binding protein PotA n=1 Tax=Kaustia mangrovi TaxID=2593653 RepID=A0A7S8C714_9HYPH|nr:ABC transporter ATP-binding protein [Kaustia mangrovi]QPC44585.1 ABC transporter ATP-binding protein [Kaustia mangrovi]
MADKTSNAGGGAGAHSVSIRDLSKYYGHHAAVDTVSLTVGQGEFLTLLGPSGSGKTTILMSIAGFVQPSGGDIMIDDRVITHLPPDKRNFGMVFQGYALFPHLTVADNVGFPLRVRDVAKDKAREKVARALDLVQMGKFADRMPSQLSGGQQQRVALARAIVFEPDLLLLDEPLSALDKKLRADLQWELKSLHRSLGATFIYVTHDQEEALSMSDQVAILRDGRIEQKGTPTELYQKPATRFVADFLGKSNFLAGTVERAAGDDMAYAVDGQRFVQSRPERALSEGDSIVVSLRPEKIEVRGDEPEMPNRVQGRIEAFNFNGSSFELHVKTDALGSLSVTTPTWRCAVTPEIGGTVWLGWDPDASTVVEDR